jgi:hypothetical protein
MVKKLKVPKPNNPSHFENLKANIIEVNNLVGIHVFLTGEKPGRRRNVEVLNKSAVVLLVACWEAFIEDLAKTSFQFLIEEARGPNDVPSVVQARSGRPLKESKDEREIWKLAGDGWREVLRAYADEMLLQTVGKLNTPRPQQIDRLFENLLGYTNLSSTWCWNQATAKKNCKKLDDLVTLRGSISHRVTANVSVKKSTVLSAFNLILRLSVISSNRTAMLLEKMVGKYPWGMLIDKGVS